MFSLKRLAVSICIILCVMSIHQGCSNRNHETHQGTPTLHFKPEGLNSGDVIPFYWDGQYHMFFMKGQNWGHVVSKDLLRWENLPDAIIKGDDPQGPDYEGIWTGSVIEHDGTFYLFYTGKNSADPKGDQKVMQARSKDLINWTKHPELTFYADGKIYWNKPINGAIDDKHAYHHQAFRDPHVIWNPEKKEWWMVFHAIHADGSLPVMALYTSTDLDKWEPCEPLVTYPAKVSGDCPDIFKVNDTWNINCADYHYMKVEGASVTDPLVREYDCGDLRVAKSMYDGKRRIIVGWIGHYENEKDSGSYQWGGVMSMPRELYADAEGLLYQRPPVEIIKHFNQKATSQKQVDLNKPVQVPQNYMLKVTFDAKDASTQATLYFRESANSGDVDNRYHLSINYQTKEIELGNRYHSYKRVCDFDTQKPVQVRLFIDDTVAECFVNDAYCFTMRIYDCKGEYVSFAASNDKCEVKDLEVYTCQ